MADFITKALTRARCPVCDWPMTDTQEAGCIPGDCSYRPADPAEQRRIRERREALAVSRADRSATREGK